MKLNRNGEPFESIKAANSAISYYKNLDGTKYEAVEIEGGFGLIESEKVELKQDDISLENAAIGTELIDEFKEDISIGEDENIEEKPVRRKKRTPISKRNILTAPKRPGYVRRFVNIDEEKAGWGRVKDFMDHGYSIVKGDVQIGDKRIVQESKIGSANIVNVGRGMKAILMEQRQEWYNEDMAARDEMNRNRIKGSIKNTTSGLDVKEITINV